MADDEGAAMALFRLHRLPTLAQLQKQAKVPTSVAPLQTDSRECLFDAPGAKATPAHCAMAFQALIDHLQGRPPAFAHAPPLDRGGRRKDAKVRAAALAVACPFYVRWEVPRYSPAQLKEEVAAHALKTHVASLGSPAKGRAARRAQEAQRAAAASAAAAATAERRGQEMRERVVRWPVNPAPWLDEAAAPAPEDGDEDEAAGQQSDGEESAASTDTVEPGDAAGSALVALGPPVQPGESRDEYERVHMDPIYDYVRALESAHGDDALWGVYFPRKPTLVKWKKVHPMDRVRWIAADGDGAAGAGAGGKGAVSLKSRKRGGRKKTGAAANAGALALTAGSRSAESKGAAARTGQWRVFGLSSCMAPQIAGRATKAKGVLALDNTVPPLAATLVASKIPVGRSTLAVGFSAADARGTSSRKADARADGSSRGLASPGSSVVTFRFDDHPQPPQQPEARSEGEEDEVPEGEARGDRLADYGAGDLKWQGAVAAPAGSGPPPSRPHGVAADALELRKPRTAGLASASAPGGSSAATRRASSGTATPRTPLGNPGWVGGLVQAATAGGGSAGLASPGRGRAWSADASGLLRSDTDVEGAPALLARNRRADPHFATTERRLAASSGDDDDDDDAGGDEEWRREVADLFDGGVPPKQRSQSATAFERPATVPHLGELNDAHFGESDEDESIENSVDSDLDEGPEVMTDASYELRGLGGTALPAPLLNHNLGEVALWAATHDPHYMCMGGADLVGAPPHTPLAARVASASLLVTAHQRRVRAHAVKRARAAALLEAQEHAVLAALAKRAAHNKHARHNAPAAGCFGGGLGACFARIRPTAPAADPSSSQRARPGRFGYRRSSSSSSVAAPADDVPLDLFDDDDCGVPPLPQETEVFRGGARVTVLLLGAFETCGDATDFDPGSHGLFATFPHPHTGQELRGLLLPPLPERQQREQLAPAPPFWVRGDATAVEGYAANRAHVLRRLLAACGFDGSVTATVVRSMHLVRFQVSSSAQMTFAAFRQHQRRVDAQHVDHVEHQRLELARRARDERRTLKAAQAAQRASRWARAQGFPPPEPDARVGAAAAAEAADADERWPRFGAARESVSAPAGGETAPPARLGPPPGDRRTREPVRDPGGPRKGATGFAPAAGLAAGLRVALGSAPAKSRQPEGHVYMRPQAVSDANAATRAHETTPVFTAAPPVARGAS